MREIIIAKMRERIADIIESLPHKPHRGPYHDPDRPTGIEAICGACRELGIGYPDPDRPEKIIETRHGHQLSILGMSPNRRVWIAGLTSWAAIGAYLRSSLPTRARHWTGRPPTEKEILCSGGAYAVDEADEMTALEICVLGDLSHEDIVEARLHLRAAGYTQEEVDNAIATTGSR